MALFDTVEEHKQKRKRASSLSGTNLERVGDYNYRVTFQAIRVNDVITRAQLVALTGLTPPAIANITNRLLQEKLILATGKVQGSRGQPPKLLTINPDGCFTIGLNIDRDHLTAVALDLAGKVRARHAIEVDFALPGQVASFFKGAVARMMAEHSIDRRRLLGVGVALPDRLSQIELPKRPKAYSEWDKVDLPKMIGQIVDGPVFVENDASAAALGELQFGHGMKLRSFFYILISAGLGGGLVIEGTQYRGAHGRSGEIGFLPLKSRRTEAEDLGQAVSLQGLYDALRSGGFNISRPEALSHLTEKGQRLVEEWLDSAASFLLPPILAVRCLIDPQAVFIGGRMPPNLVEGLIARLNKSLASQKRAALSEGVLQSAALGVDAPVIGAALLPLYDRLLPSRTALMKPAQTET
jgi:predicted NBD/HSP70 family sugar kinase